MDEQDHAKARAKLMRAIVFALPDYTEADAERLVGDLSEFVRGIVREGMRPNLAACPAWCPCRLPRCTCPWSTTAPLSLDCPAHGAARKPCTCNADWKERPKPGSIVPVSSTCPAHGMKAATDQHEE